MKNAIIIILSGVILLGIANYYLNDNKNNCPCFHPHHSEKRMKEMKQKFIEKLNLTDEQIQKADKLHEKGKKQLLPLIKELKKAKMELFKLIENDGTDEKIQEIKQKIKDLKTNLKSIKETHKREFEEILDDNQKIELQKLKKIKEEKIKKLKENGFPVFE